MLELHGRRILMGSFHDHWSRNGTDNPSLLLAAMNYHHLDFMCLMDGVPMDAFIKACIEAYCPHLKIFTGYEIAYPWGHVVTVGNRPAELHTSSRDYRFVLKMLSQNCDFVAMAHPSYVTTWNTLCQTGELDRLLDEGLLDGVQPGFSAGERDWVSARLAAGRPTSLISGWDSHLICPLSERVPVLYNSTRPPHGHIDSCSGNRTLVFADDNTLPAIVDAVKSGKSVLDNAATGEFMGCADLVVFLEKNGYREAVRMLDSRRDALSLSTDGQVESGCPCRFVFSAPGTVTLPGTLSEPQHADTDEQGVLELDAMPVIQERDKTYFPIVHTGHDGYVRAFAVDLEHPIHMTVLPDLRTPKDPELEIVEHKPFEGDLKVCVEDIFPGGHACDSRNLKIPVPAKKAWPYPLRYTLEAVNRAGIARHLDGVLTFTRAPRFRGSWECIPTVPVDRASFVPEKDSAFGAYRSWPGADVFSATVQMAWTETDFLYRACVRDAVHYQPFVHDTFYEADSIQIAIDPYLRREDTGGSIAAYLMAYTQSGPRTVRWLSPTRERTASYTPPPEYTNLGNAYLSVEEWDDGLTYLLCLPWSELFPTAPVAGTRMGLFLQFNNSDGSGMLDVLHWPQPIPGMSIVPIRWGVITLTEE